MKCAHMVGVFHFYSKINSTLRFNFRPSVFLFEAIGAEEPNPMATNSIL